MNPNADPHSEDAAHQSLHTSNLTKRARNALKAQDYWESFQHPDLRSRRIDEHGRYLATCDRCGMERKQNRHSFTNFLDHVGKGCKFSDLRRQQLAASNGALTQLPGWKLSAQLESRGKDASECSAQPPPPPPEPKVYQCDGVCPVQVTKGFVLEPELQEHWDAWCASSGGDSNVHFWELCCDMLCSMHIAAKDVQIKNSTPRRLFSKDKCVTEIAPRVTFRTGEFAAAFGNEQRTCKKCVALELKFVTAVRSTMATILKAKMSVHYFPSCDLRHLEYLTPVKHYSAKGHKKLIAEALKPFQTQV